MRRLFVCTQGTSIANGVSFLRELQRENLAWGRSPKDNATLKKFEKELDEKIANLSECSRADIAKSAAELEVLERHSPAPDIEDQVVLLATDSYLGRVCAERLKSLLDKKFNVGEVTIVRVEDLQVHQKERLEKFGISNLLECVRKRIEEAKQQGQDIILCPNGGYKGIVPFLTLAGIIYHCKVDYTFEHANTLISLPKLPLVFDQKLYDRAAPALHALEEDVEQPEDLYLHNIEGFLDSERDDFLGFVQCLPNGKVQPAFYMSSLVKREEHRPSAYLTKEAKSTLDKYPPSSTAYEELTALIFNAQNKDKLKAMRHSVETSDLLVVKPKGKTWRLLGYEFGQHFYVAMALVHDDYQKQIDGKHGAVKQKKDFPLSSFSLWRPEGHTFQTIESCQNALEKEERLEDLEEKNRLLAHKNHALQKNLDAAEQEKTRLQESVTERDCRLSDAAEQIATLKQENELLRQTRFAAPKTLWQALVLWRSAKNAPSNTVDAKRKELP